MPPEIEELDDNELVSSASNEDQDATVGAEGTEGQAASSTANDDTDQTAIDVVREVVAERGDTDGVASSAEGSEGGNAADGRTATGEPDNENFSDVPFHKHPRFQALIGERNGLREDAVRYRNVQSYLDTNNLTADEAANALATFAKAKVDPAGAFAELKPWLQELLVSAGEILPADLQERVKSGELSDAAAMEISRERAKSKSHETRQTFEQQRSERQNTQAQDGERVKAASDWEKDRRVKDPHFETKMPLIQREVVFLQRQEGMPKNADGVRDQLKRAYDVVNKTFKPPAAPSTRQQQKPAVRPVVGGAVTGTVREKPKTTLEIIRANRRSA